MSLRIRWFNHLAIGSLIALIVLCLSWELWLAPLRSGGSLLVLKAIPLLLPLFGLLRGKRYTHQWTSMFSLLYLTEGLVRAASDAAPSSYLAMVETVLALSLFVGSTGFAHATAPSRLIKAEG